MERGRRGWDTRGDESLSYGVWSLDSGVWSVQSGVCNLEPGVCNLESGVCNLESGVWKLKSGVWKLECGVWNLEPGVWSLSLETEIWSLESGVCGLRLAMGDLAGVTQMEVNFGFGNKYVFVKKNYTNILMLLRCVEARINSPLKNRRNSPHRQRDRIREGIIALLFSNTVRTPQCRHCLGNIPAPFCCREELFSRHPTRF